MDATERQQRLETALANTLAHIGVFDSLQGTVITSILGQRAMWASKAARYRGAARRLAAAYAQS